MKYFIILLFCLVLSTTAYASAEKKSPESRLFDSLSEKIKNTMGLTVSGFGKHKSMPENFNFKDTFINFSVTQNPKKTIEIEFARTQLVSLVENFLKEINADLELRKDAHRLSASLIKLTIRYGDRYDVTSDGGVKDLTFIDGEICYNIIEKAPFKNGYVELIGRITSKKEKYSDALEIVQKQGTLLNL